MNYQQIAVFLNLWDTDGQAQISLLPALRLKKAHCPCFPTSAGALIHSLTPDLARDAKAALLAIYPAEHPLELANLAEDSPAVRQKLVLGELDTVMVRLGCEAALFVPALGADTSFEAFQEIIGHLRAPDGCPWDREQTHQTLRMHLLGESDETRLPWTPMIHSTWRKNSGTCYCKLC